MAVMNAVVSLASIQDLVAEKASWGGPEWVVGKTVTAAATVAVIAGATNASNVKVQHYLDHLTVSTSIVSTVVSSVQIKDGTTVIWECQLPLLWGVNPLMLDLSLRPLRNTAGALLSAEVTGTLGAGAVTTVVMVGHSNVVSTPA